MKSPEKLLRFLQSVVSGTESELPDWIRTPARLAVSKKSVAKIRELDPEDLDRSLVAMARRCLEATSDDATPVALVFYDDAGQPREVVAYGDTSVFPEIEPENGDPDQERRSESDEEPRTDETRHQGPGDSAVEYENVVMPEQRGPDGDLIEEGA